MAKIIGEAAEAEVDEHGVTSIVKRVIMSKLQADIDKMLLERVPPLEPGGGESDTGTAWSPPPCNLRLKVFMGLDGDEQKRAFVRGGTPGSQTGRRLQFHGQVIDEQAAIGADRQFLLPLGEDQVGPQMFLDGSKRVNTKRSDCSFAFCISPVPQPKPLPAQDGKKAKTNPPEPIAPTHLIEYVESLIDVGGNTYQYGIPFLVEDPNFSCMLEKPLYRANANLGLGEKAGKAKAAPKGFGNR